MCHKKRFALKPLLDWKGEQGYDLGKPQNLKRSVVISLFDGTKFDDIAHIQIELFFGIP